MNPLNALQVKYDLAVQHFNNLCLQISSEAAMAHTLQRYDVDPAIVRRIACHESVLPHEDEIPGSVAW